MEFAHSLKDILEGLRKNGSTQRQIVDELNKAGIKTAKGGTWRLIQLQRVLKKLEL